jgi:hypothetical protein
MSEMMGVEQIGASVNEIASDTDEIESDMDKIESDMDEIKGDMVESAYAQTKTTRTIEIGNFMTRTNIPSTSAI